MDVLEIQPTDNITPPQKKSICTSEIDVIEKKNKIIGWLKLNLVPVSESGDKIIFGSASLLPPYTTEDICTDNPMVVMEMRKIIERMPIDFDPNSCSR